MALLPEYAAHPAGGYVFRDPEDGSEVHAWGEPAEQLRARIDKDRAAGRLAQNASGADAVPDVGPQMSEAAPMSPAPPPEPATGGYSPAPAPAPAPAAAPQVSAAAPPGAPTPLSPAEAAEYERRQAPPPSARELGSAALLGQALRPRFVAGSPGRDPEAEARSGVPVPQSQSIETAEALPPDLAAGLQASRESEIQGQLERGAARVLDVQTQLRAEAAATEEAMKRAEAERARQSLHAEVVAASVRSKQEGARARREQIARREVDPSRVFHSDPETGALAAILSAISVGMGAYAASRTGGPNYALQITESAIDRDVAAQRQRIEQEGLAADNELGEIMRTTGMDLEEATAALRLSESEVAQQYQRRAAIDAQNAGIVGDYQSFAEGLEAQRQSYARELAERVVGKTKVQVSAQVVQPRAATAGHYQRREWSAKDAEDLAKRTGVTVPEAAAALATANPQYLEGAEEGGAQWKPEDLPKQTVEYAKSRSALDEDAIALDQVREGAGIRRKANGQWEIPEAIEGVGLERLFPNFVQSDKSQRLELLRQWAVQVKGKALSGATVSEQQEKAINAMIGATSERNFGIGLTAYIDANERARHTLDAGYGPQVVRQYERNAAANAAVRRKQNKASASRESW